MLNQEHVCSSRSDSVAFCLLLPMSVPADVLKAINQARPVCSWHTHGRCKKGARCQFLHGVGTENEAHVPHISSHKTSDGVVKMNVRPPLHEAFDQFFKEKGRHRTACAGQNVDAEGTMIMYQLQSGVWLLNRSQLQKEP